MENSTTNKDLSSDFLSQSYSQGIERITGTKDHIVNFQVPKKVLKKRVISWDNLFDKYSEMSPELDINVETLEPEEEEEKSSEENNGREQQISMYKSTNLIQYWVNTGNLHYKALLDKKELSESGSSLSEEEINSPSHSLLSNKVNESSKEKRKTDTSFSSVDTTAYILSNANITKKADTIAIIEGAKSNGVKSSEDNCIKDAKTVCNDRTNYAATDHSIHERSSSGLSSISILKKNVTSDTNNQVINDTVIPANTMQPDVSSQNSHCDTVDKPVVSSASQKKVGLHNIDKIRDIFKVFHQTSQQLSTDDKYNTLDKSKTLKKESSSKKQMLANSADKDASLISLPRKKLYTGRNSPIDLIAFTKDGSDVKSKSKSPNTNLFSHPALDSESLINSSLVNRKDKGKRFISKKTLGSKKVQAKKVRKYSPGSNKNITSDKTVVTNNNIQNSTIDNTLQNSSTTVVTNNNTQSSTIDNMLQNPSTTVVTNNNIQNSTIENTLQNSSSSPNNVDDRNSDNLISICNGTNKASMKNIILKHVIVNLERITLPYKEKKSKSVKDATPENNVHNKYVTKSKIWACENSQSIDSDESTLLFCKCDNSISQESSSSSLHLNLSIEKDFVTKTKKKDETLIPKNADVNLKKEAVVTLERLSQSMIERYTKSRQVSSTHDDLPKSPEKLLNNSTTSSSSPHGVSVKNYGKLRELKVPLERLPVTRLKSSSNSTSNNNRSSNATKASIPIKDRIVQDASTSNNRRRKFASRNSSSNVAGAIAIKRKSASRLDDQNKRRRFTIFISSDEDDLVQLIRPKREKTLTNATSKARKNLLDDSTSVSTNENDKCDSSENVSGTTYFSKRDNLRKINRSTRERSRRNETRSSNSARCDSSTKSLNGRHYLFSNSKNTSSKRSANKTTKVNGTNSPDNSRVMSFQTKTFNIESSDSDRSVIGCTSAREPGRVFSVVRGRTRSSGRADEKELSDDSCEELRPKKLNFSPERYKAAGKTHRSSRRRSRSVIEIMSITSDEQSDQEQNSNSRTTVPTRKTKSHLPAASNARKARKVQRDNADTSDTSDTSVESDELRNKLESKGYKLRNLYANQRSMRPLRSSMFQTKNYYISDSSE